eukprot:PLAT5220.1.p1 GENE.PLAT5220.1~~PLAT5220.1.p1  ORF type:complete len:278 (+),score=93.46 PLAT5220.1:339-1172(+)
MARSALEMKTAGNDAFRREAYLEAVEYYSRALELEENERFYTNRAMAYKKLGRMKEAADDCRESKRLNPQWLKASLLLGRALTSLGDVDGAISAYRDGIRASQNISALILVRTTMETELRAALSVWAKMRVDAKAETSSSMLAALQGALSAEQLVTETELRKKAGEEGWSEDRLQAELAKRRHSTALVEAMEAAMAGGKEEEPPEYLCCPISMDVMIDPVITPSGISYERAVVEDHLARSETDPISREPLQVPQLVPNLALREMIEQYVAEHPGVVL